MIPIAIQEMKGHSYDYDGERVTIVDIEDFDSYAKLVTEAESRLHIDYENVHSELRYFTNKKKASITSHLIKKHKDHIPMETNNNHNEIILRAVETSTSTYDTLQKTLLESIAKIQEDPAYIRQATAINETIKSVIELEKVKVGTLHLLSK